MPVRVSPDELQPTHDVSLKDKNGKTVGLILCGGDGKHKASYSRTSVDRTALKTTSGNSQYSDMTYPYSPIVQDDWSGGRGNLDFERDGTKFFDSYRMRTSRTNKAFLGPQEQYTSGVRSRISNLPQSVKFHKLIGTQRRVAYRFTADTTFTAALAWIITKRAGSPAVLRASVYSDNAGAVNAELSHIDIASTRLADVLSEWLNETISQTLTSPNAYWLILTASAADDSDNHWEVAVNNTPGNTKTSGDNDPATWATADFDLYFRLTDANSDKTCILVDYKEQQYAFISGAIGAPKIYMNGDRGAADSNAGNLNQLLDATKTWVTDEFIGCVVLITGGPGKDEAQPWRKITANGASNLAVDTDFLVTHTIDTEYVILAASKWREIDAASHAGLTNPITEILVSTQGVIYCCMGDDVTVRRIRAYNDTGTWRDFDDAANCQANETAGTKAAFIAYLPQNAKIVIGNNKDASNAVSIAFMSNASVPAWATPLTWNTAKPVGSQYVKMTRLEVYPDDAGNEAVWIGKWDRPWICAGSGSAAPYPLALREMESVKSNRNFKASLVHNVYLYFPIGTGVEQYYNGQLTDMGPNLGEGLPEGRQGAIIMFAGYPGRFFAAVDAGTAGYSSLLMRDGNGWHEHYRAPLGQRITALWFQPIPGATPDRLWMYVGNDLIWLPFPSDTVNELEDSNYPYTHEGMLELSRMHAGMFDVQKIIKIIKLWSDRLEDGVCWMEADYRLNDTESYRPLDKTFSENPQSTLDFTQTANETTKYGLAGKRLQLRIRFYTTDRYKTPILLAVIIEAVMRISLKYNRPLTFRLRDNDRVLDRQTDDMPDSIEKLNQLDIWSDDRSDSMLLMRSRSRLYDGKLVFLNAIQVSQLRMKRPNKANSRDLYVCSTTVQDA